MSKVAILAVAVIFAGSVGCSGIFVPKGEHDSVVEQQKAYITALERDNKEWRTKGGAFDKHMAECDAYGSASQTSKELADALRKALAGMGLESSEIEVSPGKVVLAGDLLFDLGSWTISAKGKDVLKKVAEGMKRGSTVRIVGHTDKKPIVSEKVKKLLEWDDNIELSTKRALAVHAVFKQSGFAERQMWIEGRGCSEPRGNDKQSRRVEIFVVAPAGVAPTSFQK